MSRAADLALTRTAADRRAFALDGVGTLRMHGWASRAASAEAGGRRWEIVRRGLWQRTIEATDATGTTTGRFAVRGLRRGGSLRWQDRALTLRPASRWRERYALTDGDRRLGVLEGTGRGRRPVRLTLEDPQALDPGLVLFAAFVVRGLANDAIAASVATAG